MLGCLTSNDAPDMYAFLSQCCLQNYLILFTSHKSYTVCLFLVKEDIDPNIDQESNAQKAHRTYLKGRALNVVSDHSPEAEQLLSKAVKLGEFFLFVTKEIT